MNLKTISCLVLLSIFFVPAFSQGDHSQEINRLENELNEIRAREKSLMERLEEHKLARIQYLIKENALPKYEKDVMVVHHSGLSLSYNEEHEQANWVAHMITPDIVNGNLSRSNDFREDLGVKSGTAHIDDYWDSGFDRGHLAPSADFRWSAQAMSESYFYSNMSPQRPDFNRGRWAELEGWIRNYVTSTGHGVYVITGPVLKKGLPTIGDSEVSIPEQYFKIILDIEGDEKKGLAFLMPNTLCKYPVESYATSIDSIELLTGINFFPNLSADLEVKLESSSKYRPFLHKIQDGNTDVAPLPAPLPKGLYNTVQAANHEGDVITVCGTVVSAKWSAKSGNTYLNLDKKFPNQIFSVTIFKDFRKNFSYAPDKELLGKTICVTGKVVSYRGVPGINLENERKVKFWDEEQGKK